MYVLIAVGICGHLWEERAPEKQGEKTHCVVSMQELIVPDFCDKGEEMVLFLAFQGP